MLAEVIGHRLAEVRRARGLTQQQVGRACGDANTRLPRNLTARVCRNLVGMHVSIPVPAAPPAPPVPPRVRNFTLASSD